MTRTSDYSIHPYRSTLSPDIQKFRIIYAGKPHSVYRTEAEAITAVKNMEKDPWFFDRGYTRKDRANS